ncbi:MAG: hypothetical protein LBK26_00545 [Rickettsiales bacterium]|jgi:hypothetical protein|nr:hypothetical protein [Rickettsiales bacterium]
MNAMPMTRSKTAKPQPQLTLVKNDDDAKITTYKLARAIYAETLASSLRVVEALASMVANLSNKTGRTLSDIAQDENIFKSLRRESKRHKDLFVDSRTPEFQICLRTVRRMTGGQLKDAVTGATRFHHADNIPEWAAAMGYVADVDGLLFYL